MPRIQLALEQHPSQDAEPVVIEALDVQTALAIADINVGKGSAQIWHGHECLGRVTKHGGHHATFWELGPN